MRIKYFFYIAFMLITTCASAQVVSWQKSPQYLSIEPLSSNLLKAKGPGGYGIVNNLGEEKVSCKYETITAMAEGMCLILSGERLIGIVNPSGEMISPKQLYLVNPNYPYYSEGFLAVQVRDNATYIVNDGNPVQWTSSYYEAGPFFYGLARARKSKTSPWVHIDRSGKISPLRSGYKNSDIVFASSFTKEKQSGSPVALLIDKGNRVTLRSTNGQLFKELGQFKNRSQDNTVQVITTDSYTIRLRSDNKQILSIVQNKGGLKTEMETIEIKPETANLSSPFTSKKVDGLFNLEYEGRVFLSPQFDQPVIPISPRTAIAKKDGAFGILNLNANASISIAFPKETISFNHHTPLQVSCTILCPRDLLSKDKRICITDGYVYHEESVMGDKASVSVLPDLQKAASGGSMAVSAECIIDGIKYTATSSELRYSYRPSFHVSVPGNVKLEEDNVHGSVRVVIENTSNQDSDECRIIIDGALKASSVVFHPGDRKTYTVTKSVDLQDLDTVGSSISIRIEEKGCPPYTEGKQVSFERNY